MKKISIFMVMLVGVLLLGACATEDPLEVEDPIEDDIEDDIDDIEDPTDDLDDLDDIEDQFEDEFEEELDEFEEDVDDQDDEVDDADDGSVVELDFNADGFTFTKDGETNPTVEVSEGDTVRVTFTNDDAMPHDWVLDEFDASTEILEDGNSETIEFVADETGSFEYYCSVGSHREEGMYGEFVVE